VLINDIVNSFCDYYSQHKNRTLIYYRDRHGDKKNPNVADFKSYNKQAIELLEKRGWNVDERVHPGQEPNYLNRYHLWGNLLSEENPELPKIRFNGSRCKYTLISMNNANTKDYEGKVIKDKSSERSKNTPQEEVTHFSDAADKIVYTKYREFRTGDGFDYVPNQFKTICRLPIKKALFSFFGAEFEGKDKWEIDVIDNKKILDEKLSTSAAGNSEILFSLMVNPSVLGAGMPGGRTKLYHSHTGR
jgi:hypothetical protein